MKDILPLRSTDHVILDTDFCSDCDDMMALTLLCAETKRIGCAFDGVSVDVNGPQEGAAVAAVLEAMHRTDVPVAVEDGAVPSSGNASPYVPLLAARVQNPPAPRAALDLCMEKLRAAPDASVVFITIGFFNTMAKVVAADAALFHRKVRAVVSMAGGFGRCETMAEFNAKIFRDATAAFASAWRGPWILLGFECGDRVLTDLNGEPLPADDYLMEVWAKHPYTRGHLTRPSWDPLTVDLAATANADYYRLSPRGTLAVNADGSVVHTPDPAGNVQYVVNAQDDAAMGRHITARILEARRSVM